jgi:hypothetical protein
MKPGDFGVLTIGPAPFFPAQFATELSATKWTDPLKTYSEEPSVSGNFKPLCRNRCAGLSRRIGFGVRLSNFVSLSVFAQAFFEKACVAPKPLRRFITPLPGGFSLKPFLKRLAVKQFFKKACGKCLVFMGVPTYIHRGVKLW